MGQPPLRTKMDQDALWDGMARGTIYVVGADHVAYTREQKLDPSQTVLQHRAGMTNPAKLYPAKGTIAVGSDADLVVRDPDDRRTIRDEDALSNSGFSIHSGREVTGWPVLTIRRGDVAFENGQVTGVAGSGRLAPRGPSQPLD